MKFYVLKSGGITPPNENEYCLLSWDDWDDFGYQTQFHLKYINGSNTTRIGPIKIAFDDQKIKAFHRLIPLEFITLDQSFFSMGGSGSYYKNLSELSLSVRNDILTSLNDLVLNINNFNYFYNKNIDVLKTSLMREFFLDEVRGKFHRLANGKPELTNFSLSFPYGNEAEKNITFEVIPNSLPPTNLHVIIGGNGVGKTNFLNKVLKEYFNSKTPELTKVIYLSYSPFDKPFQGINKSEISPNSYAFHGFLKSPFNNDDNTLQTGTELEQDFLQTFIECMKSLSKFERWFSMLKILIKNDVYLTDIFSELIEEKKQYFNKPSSIEYISGLYKKLSTGHKIIIKSLTHLVNSVTEKSLVLYDEPETYLHPPLISAYLRAISWLLIDRNAIGILTTHSPIILQEIPKKCVWKILRRGNVFNTLRLDVETFGENISLLNYEVFNLTVSNTSFIDLMTEEVERLIEEGELLDKTDIFKKIINLFNNEIGAEAQAHLMKIIKDSINKEVKHEKN